MRVIIRLLNLVLSKQQVALCLQWFPPLRWGLQLGVALFAPRNQVGVYGVIFNDAGQVLMLEHVFRPSYPWGLPGGWVSRGENPADAIRREIIEELNLNVKVKKLLLCQQQGGKLEKDIPPGLVLAYYCQLNSNNVSLNQIDQAHSAFEIMSAQWVYPSDIRWPLPHPQRLAIQLGKKEFERVR